MLDFLFAPSLERLLKTFDKTRARLEAHATRSFRAGATLRNKAVDLEAQGNLLSAEGDRALRIAGRFKNLTD